MTTIRQRVLLLLALLLVVPLVLATAATATPEPEPVSGLALEKSVGAGDCPVPRAGSCSPEESPGDPVEPGDVIAYTIDVASTGTQDEPGVTVIDHVNEAAGGGWPATVVPGSARCWDEGLAWPCTWDEQAERVQWDLGTLPAGQSRQVTFAVTVGTEGPRPWVSNMAVASSDLTSETASNIVTTRVAATPATTPPATPPPASQPTTQAPGPVQELPRTGVPWIALVVGSGASLAIGALAVRSGRRRPESPRG